MPPVVATPGLGTCYKMQPDYGYGTKGRATVGRSKRYDSSKIPRRRLYGSEKDLQAKGVLMVVCNKLVYKSLLDKSNFDAIKLISDTKSL